MLAESTPEVEGDARLLAVINLDRVFTWIGSGDADRVVRGRAARCRGAAVLNRVPWSHLVPARGQWCDREGAVLVRPGPGVDAGHLVSDHSSSRHRLAVQTDHRSRYRAADGEIDAQTDRGRAAREFEAISVQSRDLLS